MTAGTRLGPYEILAPIGAGGMGEVYRARDPRLGRDVAIKISAERFSERFEREARAVAALNHPNICQIYDVGPNYLVMELVEGLTLAERIKQGAVPFDEALAIARQIGDALEAAHEKGIVHRDLKPANIKIKPDGAVKVLDFGLAKMASAAAGAENPENSPTLTIEATRLGQILGTAAYMAPEQARGKVVGKQADIWAFGVVLYEMLTGRRLFDGETTSDVLAAVLTKEPDWSRAPVRAHRLLQSCMEKDPKRRLRDIGDAWRLLEDAPVLHKANSRVPWAVAGLVSLVALISLGLWAPWRSKVAGSPSSIHVDLDLGPEVSIGSATGPAVVLSPDGTRLVFVAQGADGIRRLFTRRLDEGKSTPLVKTEGAYEPFFSPDSRWVGFFAQGELKKTRIDSGEPITLCEAPNGRGASWADDGTIVTTLDPLGGLFQVPAEGGNPTPLTALARDENTHRWPQVLPGRAVALFNVSVAYGNYDEAEIDAVSLKDHRRKMVVAHGGMYARYLPSGYLVYVTKGTLTAVPFDADRLETRGAATPLQDVSNNPSLGSAQFDFTTSGIALYHSGGTEGLRTIEWVDGAGKTVPFGLDPALYMFPRVAPDGGRLAYLVSQGANTDVWIYEVQRGSKTRLTSGGYNAFPVWSPDGQFLVFQTSAGMAWTRGDAAGKPEPLTRGNAAQFPNSFSPDGKNLAYSELTPSGPEIRILPIENRSGHLHAGQPQTFLKTATANVFAAFSPDGKWLAYDDAEAGSYEVYARTFPDSGTKVQLSNAGGLAPMWSRSGHELFYRTQDQRIMAVNYTIKDRMLLAEKPRLWFDRQLSNLGVGVNLDLAPDGKRFVVLLSAENREPRETQGHVTLVTNFFDEVRRRVAGSSK